MLPTMVLLGSMKQAKGSGGCAWRQSCSHVSILSKWSNAAKYKQPLFSETNPFWHFTSALSYTIMIDWTLFIYDMALSTAASILLAGLSSRMSCGRNTREGIPVMLIQHLHLPNIAWPRQSNNEVKDALFLTLTFIWLTSSSSSSLHRKCQTMHWSNQNITLNPVSNVFWNMTYYEQISSKHIKTLHVCGDTTCHITISQNI